MSEINMSHLVSVGQVEKELSRLYEKKGKACRSTLFNFIVWAPSSERGAYLQELVDKITDKFPCRLIFITKAEFPKLEIKVSIDAKPNITSDLIEIRAPQSELTKLPYLLLPQLLPDLPIYFLWGQDPTLKSELYNTLSPYASRIIFDSAYCDDAHKLASSLIKRTDQKLRDISWSLISGWRQVVSRAIDTSEKYESVKKAKSIDITYKEGPDIQAQYFHAWLLSKIPNSQPSFNLIPTSGEGLEGDILALDIDSSNYQFSLTRKGSQVVFHLATPDTCELPQTFPLTHIQRGFNFWRELLFEPLSPDYAAMLNLLK